ncbi:MAG: relaxase/mobilization nuclease domain-containing protein [Oscillospiraceae bacterium]|nr:relaxase/mobilization nuclease domain-containing protein [Oscillospiraceae bacterium]
MATTGFWPVKGRLKDVIDYAENPDKTIDRKYLDEDLYRTLEYAANAEKTDQRMYVTALNCPLETACRSMMETKRRFGKLKGNVAYHGYQSFRPGELTPETCHEIGLETARRMWPDYEVVVTTHLNTDSLHNHFIVNSVSFKTGEKFQNKIRDHVRLREVSDALCLDHELSVLGKSKLYQTEKDAYWVHKAGKLTHRDILKHDVEECLAYVYRMDDFLQRLRQKGYTIVRGDSYEHISVKAPDWSRAVRLDSIGYPVNKIQSILRDHLDDNHFLIVYNSHLPPKRRPLPLLSLERQLDYDIRHARDTGTVLVDLVFYMVLMLLGLAQNENAKRQNAQPMSPSMRMELAKLDQIIEEQKLLTGKGIHTVQELSLFQTETEEKINGLEAERQRCRNKLRRPKPPELTEEYKQKIAAATEELKPLRKELAVAKRIEDRWEHLLGLLEAEHDLESKELQRERGRER